jgi:hypothetical protein
MKGFNVLIDFFNYIFLLLLVSFIIIYIIVGDRISIFTNIIKTIIPLSYFLAMFLLAIKIDRNKYEKIRKEDKLDEVVIYFDRIDNIKDIVVTLILPVVVIFIAMIDKINIIDIFQAVSSFSLMYFWHLVIFMKRDDMGGIKFMTNFDVLKDRVVIFLLPIVIISIPLTQKFIDNLDIFQALSVFVIMWLWRKILLFKN